MDPQLVRDYVRRGWSDQQDAKRAHWRAVYRRQGWRVVWDAAQALLVHMRAVQPDFPGERSRADDLMDHRALKDRIDRAADAFAGR